MSRHILSLRRAILPVGLAGLAFVLVNSALRRRPEAGATQDDWLASVAGEEDPGAAVDSPAPPPARAGS